MHYGKDELDFDLVDKNVSNKRERLNENIRLKTISKNPKDLIEPEDDEPFFDFVDDIVIDEEEAKFLVGLHNREPKKLEKLANAHLNVRL